MLFRWRDLVIASAISFPRSAWERIPSDALRLERDNLYWTQSVHRLGYNAEHCNQIVLVAGVIIIVRWSIGAMERWSDGERFDGSRKKLPHAGYDCCEDKNSFY